MIKFIPGLQSERAIKNLYFGFKDLKVVCKLLTCVEPTTVANFNFEKGKKYPLWVVFNEEKESACCYDLKVVDGHIKIPGEIFGTLAEIKKAPNCKNLKMDGEVMILMNLPEEGYTWVNINALNMGAVENHCNYILKQEHLVYHARIISDGQHLKIGWLILDRDQRKKNRVIGFLNFVGQKLELGEDAPNPLVQNYLEIPISGLVTHLGFDSIWSDGTNIHYYYHPEDLKN